MVLIQESVGERAAPEHADLALYSAKKMGGGNFSFFSEELRRELDYRKQLEHDIKVAISERAFQVYFQPQVSLTDGTISGIEALVRWNHHERGMPKKAKLRVLQGSLA